MVSAEALDEAVRWSVRLHSGTGDAGLHHAWARWRDASPEHARAWAQVASVEGLFAPVAPGGLGGAALQALEAGQRAAERARRRRTLGVLGMAAAAVGTGGLLLRDGGLSGTGYATATGERRSWALADGTRLRLNTASRWESGGESAPWTLRQGDAFVQVAAGSWLALETPQARLSTRGADFFVRHDAEDGITRVQVRRGSVALHARAGTQAAPVRADAGSLWQLAADGLQSLPVAQQAFDWTAWLDGALVARRLPLSALLAELTRYRKGWLLCDPSVAALTVSGVFQLAGDTQAATDHVLGMLVRTLPVQVAYRTRYWARVRAA